MKKKKELKKLWFVLAFYAFAGGLFYNFQELWMLENGLSIRSVGIVFSLCSVLTISIIFLCSNLISRRKLKNFTSFLLFLKAFILLSLFFLNKTGCNISIKFLIMMDYVIDAEVYTCIYPLMSFIRQDDELYALQDLAYEAFYSLGILATSFFLGKTLFTLSIHYNTYCLVASLLLFLAFLFLHNTVLPKPNTKQEEPKNDYDLFLFLNQMKKDKISISYFFFTLFGEASYACIMEMLMILLTEVIGFSPQFSSNFSLVASLVAVGMGGVILKFLTFKNDYLNLFIKYGGRILFYFVAFLSGSKMVILFSVIYAKLFSDSYVHVTEAPYVNRISKSEQFAFLNIGQMITYFGTAVGVLLCGLVVESNVGYVFLIATLLAMCQLFFGYKGIYLRTIEKGSV